MYHLAWREVLVEPGLDKVKLDCSWDTWPRGRDCARRPFLGIGMVTFCLVSLTSICSRALVMPDSAEPTWYWVVCCECCVMLELEWLS